MRLIDTDELMSIIKANDYLLSSHINSTDRGMFTIGIQQAVDMCETVVTGTTETTSDGWIPVSERLPTTEEYQKNDSRFIVTNEQTVYQAFYNVNKQLFYTPFLEKYNVPRTVLAWMPMPEPYKEREKE